MSWTPRESDAEVERYRAIFKEVTAPMEHWKGEIGVKVPLENLPEGATADEVAWAVTFFVGAGDAWVEGDYMVVYSPGYWAVIGA